MMIKVNLGGHVRICLNTLIGGLFLVSIMTSVITRADEQPAFNTQHPVDAALFQSEDGSWVFKSFPSGSRLFVFDGDSPGKSNCNRGCASAWPPLYVSNDRSSEQIGDWTVILRDDGKRQWAYKGRPVYRRYHDLPTHPDKIAAAGFRLLQP